MSITIGTFVEVPTTERTPWFNAAEIPAVKSSRRSNGSSVGTHADRFKARKVILPPPWISIGGVFATSV